MRLWMGLAFAFLLPAEARAEGDSLAVVLSRADQELAKVFPKEPWELFCRVRWSNTGTASAGSLWSMIEPCEAGTEMAPGFEPMTAYVRIAGDDKALDAELRTTGLRGCWKLKPTAAKRIAKKRIDDPITTERVLIGHQLGPAHLIRRGIQGCSWARKLVLQSQANAARFEHTGSAATHGPLYSAKLGGLRYLLAFDADQRLRWMQVGTKKQGTQIDLRPEGSALVPYRFRFQSPKGVVWFEWTYRQVDERWLPHHLTLGSPQGQVGITLEDCSLESGAWTSAKPLTR